MSATSDPRITNQKNYLLGVVMAKKVWLRPEPDWDHDHYAFCWVKFAESDIPDALHEGYTTQNGEHWVCAECFTIFQEEFRWLSA